MNTTNVSPSSIANPVPASVKTDSRCPYLYPNGKRCSLPGSPAHSGFCSRHSQTIAPVAHLVPVQNDSEDLSAELLPELSQFSSGLDISMFLARLLMLITKGRVSPRRASVMAYVTTSSYTPIAPSPATITSRPNNKKNALNLTSATGPNRRMALALRDPPAMSVPSKPATSPTPDPRQPSKRTESWKQISLLTVLIVEWG